MSFLFYTERLNSDWYNFFSPDKPPPEQSVATNDGFPADNVIHVGVDRKNEGTITDSGSFSATFCASASLWTSLTLWTICIVLLL